VVGVECTSGDPEIVGTDVPLAVARRPNTHDLGLEQAGVKTAYRKIQLPVLANVYSKAG
jgi:pyruvate/2-oxoglutarate dehydrogenase complex dihydrolipoamide dehydrogenase (E3) component